MQGLSRWSVRAPMALVLVAVSACFQPFLLVAAEALPKTMAAESAAKSEAAGNKASATEPTTPIELTWLDDYPAAMQQASDDQRLLFVWFYDAKQQAANDQFVASILHDPVVAAKLQQMTLVKVPLTAEITENDKPLLLLDHRSFAELKKRPGLAMIDFRDAKQKYHGWVVSIYPFQKGTISKSRLQVLCDLPPGTLSQRTLIFAVRTHPAAPKSAWSPHSNYLSGEAEKHSLHQARINLQGHHNWESRFHQINQGLAAQIGGRSFSSKEVCAESWPGQSLLDAAEECVHSWSQSSGHWSAVSGAHAFFGYDMKRGSNGVWYATGIFGGN